MDRTPGRLLPRSLEAIYGETVVVLRILCVALRISLKKWNLSLPIIAAVLLPSSLLSFLRLLLFDSSSILNRPILNGGRNNGKGSSNILVFADFGFLMAHCALDLFQVTITVFGASAAYREPQPSLKDLLRRIRRDWEGPVVAQLCVATLRAGYGHLLDLFSDALLPLMTGPSSLLLTASWVLVGISGSLFFYYLDAAWATSAAAAAVDDCGGFRAVALAAEMTARRRRVSGMILLLLFQAFSAAVSWIMDKSMALSSPGAVQLSIFLIYGNLAELLRMLKLAALTIYYCRCRRSRPAEDGSGSYTRLDHPPPR